MSVPDMVLGAPATPDAGPQRNGRTFVVAINAALRAIRFYPIENAAVQKAMSELGNATERILGADGLCEVRCVGDQFFVNHTRLRLAYDNYSAVTSLLALFRSAGLGGLRVAVAPEIREWVVLLSVLQSPPLDVPAEGRSERLRERLREAAIEAFDLLNAADSTEPEEAAPAARERARRVYARTIEVTRDLLNSARLGRSQGLRHAKRAVQSIVDMILSDGASLLGVTTLRDFDEYTFVHSVNVCILSVALGRRIGLSKIQLLDLGMASLLHDIGKSRIPIDILNKQGPFGPDELAIMRTHTWQGLLALFRLPSSAVRPWRAMTAAYEHHLRTDQRGYPAVIRPRVLSFYSRIIAVADTYDAATTERVYREAVRTPQEALRSMQDVDKYGLDPVLVRAFINLVGTYPIGSLVVLDSHELAVVMAPNPDTTAPSRPTVRIIMNSGGDLVHRTDLVDLSAKDENGQYLRSILRSENPERYAIEIGDYFS